MLAFYLYGFLITMAALRVAKRNRPTFLGALIYSALWFVTVPVEMIADLIERG